MASQVLSGSGNVSYTNNTGQNVRVVINYMASVATMSWTSTSGGTVSISGPNQPFTTTPISGIAIGRNLATVVSYFGTASISANNMMTPEGLEGTNASFPTELILSSGQTFSANCAAYNIVVIPEGG